MTKQSVSIKWDTTFKVGRSNWTLRDSSEHMLEMHKARLDFLKADLNTMKEIGEHFIKISGVLMRKEYGIWLTSPDNPVNESNISKQDRSDYMFIAKNWNVVVKMMKSPEYANKSLGVSAIRKNVGKNSAGNTSKGKGGKPTAKVTAATLAEKHFQELMKHGIKLEEYVAELAKVQAKG